MSCQRGNVNRVRPQKYKNVIAFKNNRYDSSKRIKMINDKEIAEVCKKCQDIIAWKVKYRKYKPLSQPKTCIKCHNKSVKDAYYNVCLPCAKNLEVCCKCGNKEEIVSHFSPSEKEQLQAMAQLDHEVKALPERKRRTYYRYLKKLKGKKKPQPAMNSESINAVSGVDGEAGKEDLAPPITPHEYITSARRKLEELKDGMGDHFEDDLEGLSITSDDDDDDDDDDDWEEES
ncbi:hypothetical protein Pcinc_009248 [Petrolisthes cinctipes]|uniref:Uncharacterized protein n=1 Tax=Petrolisthes cinctipes TaxID=88211 RepID=A0AAE1KYP1_PETCI|nr:hypothetical protein Pcinc_009248 [Petrolisthes cinctipes]